MRKVWTNYLSFIRFFVIEGRKRNYNVSEVTQDLKLIDEVSPY
jgi:hypothetical protein